VNQIKECDLLIIGGGPAGLSAAITGASEGLSVALIDNGNTFGGQARESSAIENYPGFPEGVTGEQLMTSLVAQAYKFHTDMWCPVGAIRLVKNLTDLYPSDRLVVTCDDYTQFVSKAVILTLGLTYRRLPTRHLPLFLGYGAYYGMPNSVVDNAAAECSYVIVGGANSAGQAAMHLAKNEKATIRMVIRGKITDKMSAYLLDRIKRTSNITYTEGATVTEVGGEHNRLTWCIVEHEDKTTETIKCKCLFIFIGASPRTYWLEGALDLDENKFIRTWNDISTDVHQPPMRARLPFETSMDGVFACGDVRLNSTKRVASAVGEGATALQMCHQYLTHYI